MAVPFFVFPEVRLRQSPQAVRAFRYLCIPFAIGVYSLFVKEPRWMPFFDNMLSPSGFLPLLATSTLEEIFPVWFRISLTLIGFMGALRILKGVALLCADKNRGSYADVILWSSLAYVLFVCLRGDHFDRYSLLMMPLGLLALMRSCDPEKEVSLSRKSLFLTSCILYSLFSVTLTHDYFRFTEAKWEAARAAEKLESVPSKINGGHEYSMWTEKETRWSDWESYHYVVNPIERSGFSIVQEFPYRALWGAPHRKMLLLKRNP